MQAKQAEESPFFIGQRKSGTLVWHEQIDQAPQNVETNIEFPRSEFHHQMANKRK
jgi:hypothetical protein